MSEEFVISPLWMDRSDPLGNSEGSDGRRALHIIDTTPGAIVLKSTIATNTTPSVTNVTSSILASNSNRKFAIIFNNSGATVYIKLGAAAVVNQGIRLAPNETFEITAINLFTGAVNAIKSTAASINLDVCEGT
jgi:hypothetical protein